MARTPRRARTTPQIAEKFGVSPNTVKAWIRDGKVPSSKRQGRRLLSFREVQQAIDAGHILGQRQPKGAEPKKPQTDDEIERRKQLAITEKHEAQAAKLRGELIPKEDVDACAADVVAALLEGFRSVARAEPRETREYAEDLAERAIKTGLARAKVAIERLMELPHA